MPGSPDTQPAPDLPDEQRLALVVATESYDDASLRRLRAPGHDAEDLRGVLADPDVGGFSVTSVTDGTAQEVRIAVGDFLADRRPDDLVLVYLSCHGLVDLRRRLYFAARDTTKARLAATGVEAQWLLEQLEDCRAKRQVLILDCCFSGAFALGAKGDADLGIGERFHGQGRGRVVLTASRDSEYSFEGEPVPGQAVPGSVFTSALVDGIRSGAADLDRDGYVSVDDAYGYAFDTVRASNAEQTPQRWFYGAEGSILLARNPAGLTITPADVPDGILSSLDSSYPSVRVGAVEAMAGWLDDDDPARRLAARQTLMRVAKNDRPEVAAKAQALLDSAGTSPPDAVGPGAHGDHGAGTAPPGPSQPSRVPRWLSGRRPLYAVGATLLAVVVVAGGITLLTRGPEEGGSAQDVPDSAQSEDLTGAWTPSDGGKERTITVQAPWRLEVNGDSSTDGCQIDWSDFETGNKPLPETIYGTYVAQIHNGGRLRLSVNDKLCTVIPQPGPGEKTLPFRWDGEKGDTEAFRPRGNVVVDVTTFNYGDTCTFTLRDVENGTEVAQDVATKQARSVTLDPTGASEVYLDWTDACHFRVGDTSS